MTSLLHTHLMQLNCFICSKGELFELYAFSLWFQLGYAAWLM